MDGGRDGGSVECAETLLFSIKGFEFPLLFIYSPTVIKTTGWNIAEERKSSGTVNKDRGRKEGRREEEQGDVKKVKRGS